MHCESVLLHFTEVYTSSKIEKRGKQALEGVIDIKTVKKGEEYWEKYYAGNKLVTIPVKKITTKKLKNSE